MNFIKKLAIAGAAASLASSMVFAADAGKHPNEYEWTFKGPMGKYDRESVQRGFQVYKEVCAACHSLNYFKFRNLAAVGFTEDEIKAIAAEYEVAGEPDDYGDPTTRTALPQDGIPAPFPNEQAARAANGGALPPDLSVITRARHYGADYIRSLLTGYEDPPTAEIADKVGDKYYNPYFKGGAIGMAAPLGDGYVEYSDGSYPTMDEAVEDVTYFLAYVADPHLEQRHSVGLSSIGFLIIMTVLLYLSKKKIWAPVYAGRNVVEEAEEKEKQKEA